MSFTALLKKKTDFLFMLLT